MKPKLGLRASLVVAVTLAMTAVPAFAATFLLDYFGYSYFTGAAPGVPGSCFNAVGEVPAVNSTYLTFDYVANEYTFTVQNVCFVSADTVGTNAIWTFSSGTIDIYCDSKTTGTAFDYGIAPPNGTSPSTFEDGENVLGGDVNNLVIVFDLVNGTGDFQGMVDVNHGTQLANIPVDQRSGWTLAGLNSGAPGIPVGYASQIDGQVFLDDPVATEQRTWGSLKTEEWR